MKKLLGVYAMACAIVLTLAGYGFTAGDASAVAAGTGLWFIATVITLVVLSLKLVWTK